LYLCVSAGAAGEASRKTSGEALSIVAN